MQSFLHSLFKIFYEFTSLPLRGTIQTPFVNPVESGPLTSENLDNGDAGTEGNC